MAATAQSMTYRKRASALAKQADASSDHDRMARLLQEALSWIAVAENEEFIAAQAGYTF
jgi:hypothetical protein